MAAAPAKPSPPSSSVPRTPGEIPPEQALKAIDEVSGVHAGARAAHARGTVCTGIFTALEETPALTSAAQMQGAPVDAIVRFSNAPGDPAVPDGVPDARGMAVRLGVPDGATDARPIDIVGVTLRRFFVNTPKDFVAFNRCFKNGGPGRKPKPRPSLLPFLLRHPEAIRPFLAVARIKPVPSYAKCRYDALHAYRWINRSEEPRYVRYSWIPEEGEHALARRAARGRPQDYLQRDLIERLGRTPARPFRFHLFVQFATDDDEHKVHKPAAGWKGSRKCVGVLELNGLAEPNPALGPLVFDPTRVTPGIQLSDDEILRFRPRVYELSVDRRRNRSEDTT